MQKNPYSPQLKLGTYPHRVVDWLEGRLVYPITMEFSISMNCNASCPWCFYAGEHDSVFLDTEVAITTIQELYNLGLQGLTFSGGGEPTVHPEFEKIALTAAVRTNLAMGLFTNGLKKVLNPHLFDWIRISVTDSYKLPKSNISHYSKFTNTGVCLNYCDQPYDLVERLCLEAKDAGAHHFQVRPALAAPNVTQTLYTVPRELQKHSSEGFQVIFPEYKWMEYNQPRQYDKCYGSTFCPAISPNGDVNICMYHLGERRFVLGNLYEDSFERIWKRNLDKSRSNLDKCQICCKNHEINKYLYAVKHPDTISNREFL